MHSAPVIEKTEAVLLEVLPQGETSAWLKWLSRDAGRLVTLAKGFHRVDSPFASQAKELARSEVVYYRRSGGLHFLREASLLGGGDFAGDWRRMAAAGYAAGLVDRAIPPGDGEGAELYPLLARTLAAWETRRPGPAGILRFEAELLDELGLLPHWEATPAARAGSGAETPRAVREAMERMRRGDGTLTALPRGVFREMKDFLSRLLAEAAPADKTILPTPRDIVFSLLEPQPTA